MNFKRSMAAALFCFVFSGLAAAADKIPQSLLWVGNSFFYYNNSMHIYVLNFARADKNLEARAVSGVTRPKKPTFTPE